MIDHLVADIVTKRSAAPYKWSFSDAMIKDHESVHIIDSYTLEVATWPRDSFQIIDSVHRGFLKRYL